MKLFFAYTWFFASMVALFIYKDKETFTTFLIISQIWMVEHK